jgi:hypothetical protein
MVCRATTSEAKLVVAEQAAGQPPKVENRLGTRIKYVLLRDSRGEYFFGQSLPDRAVKSLSSADLATAKAALNNLDVKPQYPYDNYDPEQQNDHLFVGLGVRRFYMASSDAGAGDPGMTSSLLETNIDAALDPAKHPLAPGTYVAIVEHSPLMISGVPRAREEASFHVIRGRY